MSGSYDEDIQLNPFLERLRNEFSGLWEEAVERKCCIFLPKASVYSDSGKASLDEKFYRRHIVKASPDSGEELSSLDGQAIVVRGADVFTLDAAVAGPQGQDGDGQSEVAGEERGVLRRVAQVLLEETLVEEGERSVRLVCVSARLDRPAEEEDQPVAVSHEWSSPGFCLSSLSRAEEGELVERTLFAGPAGPTLKATLRRKALAFQADLDREASRLTSPQQLAALVQRSLEDLGAVVRKRLRRELGRRPDRRAQDAVRLALELFLFPFWTPRLFFLLRALLSEEEASLNRQRRLAEALTAQKLGVDESVVPQLGKARRELGAALALPAPHSRLAALRGSLIALAPVPCPDQAPHEQLSSDQLIPALLFLIVSSPATDWASQLAFLTDFRFSSTSEDELSFVLASFTAAAEHIKDGGLWEAVTKSSIPAGCEDLLGWMRGGDENRVLRHFRQSNACEVEAELKRRCHPLCECAQCGALGGGARQSVLDKDLGGGVRAMHLAAWEGSTAVLGALVREGAEVEARTEAGETALHWAVRAERQSAVLLLLGSGAKDSAEDERGDTPLHTAARLGSLHCAKALLYYDQHCGPGEEGGEVSQRLARRNRSGETPLGLAVAGRQAELAEALVQCGADPTARDARGAAPADLADDLLLQKLLAYQEPALDFVIVAKAATPSTSPTDSPLKHKTEPASIETPRTSRSSTRSSFDEGVNQLMQAVRLNDAAEVVRLVGRKRESADEKAVGKDCHPLCQCGDCAERRLSEEERGGVRVDGQSGGLRALHVGAQSGSAAAVEALLEGGADAEARDPRGRTPAHLAAFHNRPGVLELLGKHGARLDARDEDGRAPVHCAVEAGATGALRVLLNLHPASLHLPAPLSHDSPLHLAVRRDSLLLTNILLDFGADRDALNATRLSPLDLARSAKLRDLLTAQHRQPQPANGTAIQDTVPEPSSK